jgi:hypothetical protein
MAADRLQLQRLELKYLISEDTALAVREFVRAYLAVDEFGANKPNYSYAIHSLYLDSDDLRTYWETINGNKNRYKLRIRYYDDRPESPVFFELKRRMNDAILKQRGAVKRAAVDELLQGRLPDPDDLLSSNPKQLVALQNFCRLMLEIQAKPKGHVAYLREAWVSTHDNSVRVTMDREVRFEPRYTADLSCRMEHPVYPFEPQVILELKFTGRYPNWFRDLVQAFNLFRVGAAKYADGILVSGMEQQSYGQPVNGEGAVRAQLRRLEQRRALAAIS